MDQKSANQFAHSESQSTFNVNSLRRLSNPATRVNGLNYYAPIEEHGLIGNMHTSALVSTQGSIDWFCYPSFDSGSIFCSLLDHQTGGSFSIRPTGTEYVCKQNYHFQSNILYTRFLSDQGIIQLTDYMPIGHNESNLCIVRQVDCIRGPGVEMELNCSPAFNYSRDDHTLVIFPEESNKEPNRNGPGPSSVNNNGDSISSFQGSSLCNHDNNNNIDCNKCGLGGSQANGVESERERADDEAEVNNIMRDKGYERNNDKEPLSQFDKEFSSSSLSSGAIFSSSKLSMVLSSSSSIEVNRVKLTRKNQIGSRDGVRATFFLKEGQREIFAFGNSKSLESNEFESLYKMDHSYAEELKAETLIYWRDWLSQCSYEGRWREIIHRSALLLKLCTFQPTGAIVAAPTTSLPECIGGIRNWDYRFTWIRDSAFVIDALVQLGFRQEAKAFRKFILQRCSEAKVPGQLQIMYSIHGESELVEEILDNLDGYKGSRPVRIGNAAYDQFQLDIYGEIMNTLYLCNVHVEPVDYDTWIWIRNMADWVSIHYCEPDQGIWETRSGPQHFVYSKVMAWVAMDRAIKIG